MLRNEYRDHILVIIIIVLMVHTYNLRQQRKWLETLLYSDLSQSGNFVFGLKSHQRYNHCVRLLKYGYYSHVAMDGERQGRALSYEIDWFVRLHLPTKLSLRSRTEYVRKAGSFFRWSWLPYTSTPRKRDRWNFVRRTMRHATRAFACCCYIREAIFSHTPELTDGYYTMPDSR